MNYRGQIIRSGFNLGRVDNWSRERLLSPFFANQGGCSYAIQRIVLEQPTSQMCHGVQSGGKRDGRSLVISLSTRPNHFLKRWFASLQECDHGSERQLPAQRIYEFLREALLQPCLEQC